MAEDLVETPTPTPNATEGTRLRRRLIGSGHADDWSPGRRALLEAFLDERDDQAAGPRICVITREEARKVQGYVEAGPELQRALPGFHGVAFGLECWAPVPVPPRGGEVVPMPAPPSLPASVLARVRAMRKDRSFGIVPASPIVELALLGW